MNRRLALAGAALVTAASLVAGESAAAQGVAARFDVSSVGDSTFTFYIGGQAWVRRKPRGIVVDPSRRDALVARFQLLGVRDSLATALVTGQTTRVTTDHVVVMAPPPPPRWFARPTFWGGAAAGAVAGAAIGLVVGRD